MEIQSMKAFSKILNDQTFTDYYYRLMLLARSVFKWENLPGNINEKWVEYFLFHHGKCVVYEDPLRGIMVAECLDDGKINNYHEPLCVKPAGIDVQPITLTPGKDCVIIRNNDEMIPTSFTLKLFAYRLAEISRTIDVNIQAQKTPVLITGSDKQMKSLHVIYNQYDGNKPVIFGDKSLDNMEIMKVLNTNAPVVFPQLQVQKTTIWNECLTFLGINNANTEKRERLITDEVTANNTHIDLSAECFLKARQRAADEINELFGTSCTVERRESFMESERMEEMYKWQSTQSPSEE